MTSAFASRGVPGQAAVACVIPALDSAATLPAVVTALRLSLPDAKFIVIDDGSRDGTRTIARKTCDTVLHFDQNRGKGAALRLGIASAVSGGASVVLTIDADGQHDPAYAPALIRALDDADIAIGARRRPATPMPLRRRATNFLASTAIGAITGARIPDSQSGFRAIRRAVFDYVVADGDRYEYETDFLIRAGMAGFRIAAVPISTKYCGASHFRSVTDSARIVRTIWRHRTGAFR
ncbi:MAG: glycosyltransferase family 2 protein [Gemmatimonadota bacterium]|nr:glycosyltransferase family 2 protein [Gemmatimonadota bacterium]